MVVKILNFFSIIHHVDSLILWIIILISRIKLFLDSYLVRFLDTSAKLFFFLRISEKSRTKIISHTMKIAMFFANIVLVASAHLVDVSISMGISSMIVDMPKAENRPNKGTIWGTAMATSATGERRTRTSYFLLITIDIRNIKCL